MKRVIFFVLMMCLSSGCGGSSAQQTPTPGMDAVSAGVLLIQQDMALRLTQQAIDAERVETGARMTATQQVISAQETAQERGRQQQLADQAATATYQVFEVTRDAAYAQATSTAQAQATGTAQAFVGMTATIAAGQTATSVAQTQEAPIIAARNKEIQAQADSVALAAERERMMNGVIAWGPWVIVFIALGAAIYFGHKYFRIRIFKADERGDAPYLVIGNQIIDLDALPGPLLDLATKSAPLLTSPENAANIKARDQFIDLNTRGLPYQFQERKPTGQMPMPGPSSKVEIAPYGDVQKLLGAAEDQLGDEEVG